MLRSKTPYARDCRRLCEKANSGGNGMNWHPKSWWSKQPRQIPLDGPTLKGPVWQMCTAAQFEEDAYTEASQALFLPAGVKHRKLWEWAYIRSALLSHFGSLEGKRGLGFGVGREPLVANFAGAGAAIVATDLGGEEAAAAGWIETDQHAASLEALRYPGHCPADLFNQRVAFRAVDMNAIPVDLVGFDFLWSSCSLEHLGSLQHGMSFIENSMRCLRPGGLAVHTTEFNVSSNGATMESSTLSIYRRRDIEALATSLASKGHSVPAINFSPGDQPLDLHIDLPPYSSDRHLKLRVAKFDTTSFGMNICAAG